MFTSLGLVDTGDVVLILKSPSVEVGLSLESVGHQVLISWGLFGTFISKHFVNVPAVGLRGHVGNHVRFN